MRYPVLNILFLFTFMLLSSCFNSKKSNWPQYRNDPGRNGYTSEKLPDDLRMNWVYHFTTPDISWKGVNTRMTFDHAYHPVIAGRLVFIGNSNDCRIYALNRKTGKITWTFFTDGPVRFAPAIHKNKLYAASDDGYIYCLSAHSGKMIWKKYCGPKRDLILGNERLVSRWPVRGGLVIKDGILYAGAGIWPSEKIFIYALDPDDGKVLWVNDSSGEIGMAQPHGGAYAISGISAQGYLATGGDKLFIPTGRAVPAALDLKSGEFKYFHLQKMRNIGGSEIMAVDSFFFSPGGNSRFMTDIRGDAYSVFNNADGSLIPDDIKSEAIALTPEYLYCINNLSHKVEAYSIDSLKVKRITIDRRGEKTTATNLSKPVWTASIPEDYAKTLIVSNNRLIAGTVTEKVMILDSKDGRLIATHKVNGIPLGLAVAHKSLFVSTDKGTLYCFNNNSSDTPDIQHADNISFDYVSDSVYVNASREIIAKSSIKDGYCLDIGCGDASLAYELAINTNLRIIALDKDISNVSAARQKLAGAGLYGSRVTVLHGDLSGVSLPPYFANLIVSQKSIDQPNTEKDISDCIRFQKPGGGIIITGSPGEMKTNVRAKLTGSGEWTHQYHDPANTASSEDEIVNGALEILWFKDTDFEMPSRHGRGVAPLYKDGRLFVGGTHGIRVVDAYNGHLLWEYPIEDFMTEYDQEHLSGTSITQGSWCIEGNRLFVKRGKSKVNRAAKDCYVLDTETGKLIDTYKAPDGGYWGYLAVKDGLLYGSVANEEHIVKWGYRESDMDNQFSESESVFAIDVKTGKTLWTYRAKNSIRHNAIAIGNNKFCLIDRPIAESDLLNRIGNVSGQKPGILVTLDARTGNVLYRKNDDIWGTLLILNEKYNKLIMTYTDIRYNLPSEKAGKISVLDLNTGNKIWESGTRMNLPESYKNNSHSRPVVNDSIIFFEPETFDLFTGKVLHNSFSRSYGCGIVSGSRNMLFYRSATLGYLCYKDIEAGTQNYGGIRPGCWINVIPCGGLVLMPDATNKCDCSYLIRSWIALKPKTEGQL